MHCYFKSHNSSREHNVWKFVCIVPNQRNKSRNCGQWYVVELKTECRRILKGPQKAPKDVSSILSPVIKWLQCIWFCHVPCVLCIQTRPLKWKHVTLGSFGIKGPIWNGIKNVTKLANCWHAVNWKIEIHKRGPLESVDTPLPKSRRFNRQI